MPSDICYVDDLVVNCDGNGPGNGHPRVFLNLGEKGQIECPYCSRQFVYLKDDEMKKN